ncbi:uncharacterized protein LACBIDRAFT_305165 [Laccaria bicolor S238N-H82]|uniref:Predicted protein n=1 Tax=Laccaria bicolor (strain S238N-H82 / ATCC MYA-4686) TaxID=486041 RepID=B0CTK6_LACBS|nr:uncharacterized protein LACBIDRAFT_305165 [Laccaria bicolor S238N-H82]EDR13939.1 predicted protein [Laccaria bicolor S238N-H82]|eukprot:XP_001874498.1 predicted protein [Laccaria bicolor S238N-H82]
MAADNQLLIVTNLVNGIDIHSLPPGQPLRSFTHPIHLNVPLLVSSALQGSLIVVGGDNGSARVYDSCVGLLTVLPHGQVGTLVQIVTTYSSSDGCLIITGSSDSNGAAIKVWEPAKVKYLERYCNS